MPDQNNGLVCDTSYKVYTLFGLLVIAYIVLTKTNWTNSIYPVC